MESLRNRENVFGICATGAGKSVCYQSHALMKKGTVLVFSPLIALMKDQVDQLKERGIRAERISSDMPQEQVDEVLQNIGSYKLLYVAPERLKNKEFIKRIETAKISLVVLDECHVLSMASKTYRPSYMLIGPFVSTLNKVPILALTATADEEIEREVVRALKIRYYTRVMGAIHRPNLVFKTTNELTPTQFWAYFTKEKLEFPAIVYCVTRKLVEETARHLKVLVADSDYYHAGRPGRERHAVQDAFMRDELRLIVSTNAFGMGINKLNIRTIVHKQVPGSLFAYIQEAGRSGRDGRISNCVLNISQEGLRSRQYLIKSSNPSYPIYENIWEYLSEKVPVGHQRRLSDEEIRKEVGLTEYQSLWVQSALRFMEYKGCISTSPSTRRYNLTILDMVKCRQFCGRFDGIELDDRRAKITIGPGQDDFVDEMVRAGAVAQGEPKNDIIMTRRSRILTVLEEDVTLKLGKDLHKLEQLQEFAATHDKKGFIERAFSEGGF